MIEDRLRELSGYLIRELKKIDGVEVYTDPAPDRSANLVVFRPGALDPRRFATALATNEGVVATVRAGQDRPGLRVSPHVYNTMAEMEKLVAATRKYVAGER